MKTQERARNLLARRRLQLQNRRASMLGRSNQELNSQVGTITGTIDTLR